MEKDMESYVKHEQTYQKANPDWIKEKQQEMEQLDYFKKYGFKRAVETNPAVRALHIDIGSGAGWLLKYTAPYFKKVVAIEPSIKATEYARAYNAEFSNIQYINADMLETMKSLDLSQPYFVTTAIVLAHIKEFHVKNTLAFINQAPQHSVLLFNEPYGRNIQQPFWRLYNKKWWRENLPDWDLEFLDIRAATWGGAKNNYLLGIYGVRRAPGGPSAIFPEKDTWLTRTAWTLNGYYYKIRYATVRFLKQLLGIRDKY